MATPKIVVGARVVVYLNNQPYGRVMGFQWTSNTSWKPIYALDGSGAVEMVPTQTRVSGTVQVYRTVSDGGAAGAGMTTQFQDVVRQRYFSLALVDRTNGAILFQATKCVLQSESWTVPTKAFVTGTLNFEALDWENEVPSAPN